MATYRQIYMTFWSDPKVDEDFTPEDKYFYLYLMTNPHTNICGCYEIGYKQMAREVGYNEETIKRLIHRMTYVHQVIDYNEETKEMLIINWHKYNWTSSPKLDKALTSALDKIKNQEFKRYLSSLIGGENTVSIPYTYGMDTTDTVTDTVPVSDTDSIYLSILNYWNEKVDKYRTNNFKVPKHTKVTSSMEKAMQKALSTSINGFNDVTTAIERYMIIGNDNNYYFNYVWTLEEFLKQSNAYPDFLDTGSKWLNYINSKSGKKRQEQEVLNTLNEDMGDWFK